MSIRRVVVAHALMCLIGASSSIGLAAQSLGAAAAAAARQREAAGRQPPAATPGNEQASPASPDNPKPAVEPRKPTPAESTPRKVYTQDDLPGYKPEDRARAEERRKLDDRYKVLLRRFRQLEAKTKEDVRTAMNAEMELKIFNLDMANRRKVEQRKALENKIAQMRVVVQHNLVILEGLRAEQRELDAERERLQAR
jgi:hypothetical protein